MAGEGSGILGSEEGEEGMKADQQTIDQFINASLAFGTPLPSSVNEQLSDNGYDRVQPILILMRASEILAEQSLFDAVVRGDT